MGRRRALRALGVAGLAVALTGCMKIDMDLTVNADDTVDGVMIMAVDRSLAEMSGDAEGMVEEMLGGDSGIPEGATAERYEDDDFIGAEYTFADIPLTEFEFDETDSESLSIVREGDEFVATGVLDFSGAGEDMGEMPPGMAEGVMDSMDVRIAITFPGEVIDATGEIDGTTVTWVPTMGERLEIQARAKDSGGAGFPIWAWILIGVVILAAVAALVYFLSRSRKSSDQEEPADAEYAEAGAGYGPPPQPGATPQGGSAYDTTSGAAAAGAAAAAASTGGPPEAGTDAGAAGPVEDVPPAPPTYGETEAYEEPTTFGDAGQEPLPEDESAGDAGTGNVDEPAAPAAPEPPTPPAGAGEGPDDVTTVSDTQTDAGTEPPADTQEDGDTLEPPR